MSKQSEWDRLSKLCATGEHPEACKLLGEKNMAGFKDGGLLADASRTWRMESDYPEFEKGIADRLSKERVPEAEIEEQFNYSPLQRGYAEGGEVDFDAAGSMLAPEVPLDFNEEGNPHIGEESIMGYDTYADRREASDFPTHEDEMMMEEEDTMGGLTSEDEEILFQALSDYPELEEILNKLGAIMSPSMDVFDEEGSVEGPGTGTSDSIPANLSDGEFVFTAKAVKQLGVDKLRKMMAKAEEDYNDGDAEQMIAQMGDEGFAAGGLLTKPKYGSYAYGGNVNYESIPTQGLFEDRLFEGQDYSLGQIISMSRKKRYGKDFLSRVSRIGNTKRYRVRGMKHGGTAYENSANKAYDRHPDNYGEDEGGPVGELTPGIGKEERRRKLGTMLFKLLNLDPVTFTHPSKVPSGKRSIDRESSFLERV